MNSLDADESPVAPLAAGACPAAALVALGAVLHQVCRSMLRDRALLKQWLSNLDGVQA